MTLRLTPQMRTRLANASFLTAFLFSIFTVSYLSGQSPGRLPCPARPNGTGQRAEADHIDGKEIVYVEPPSQPSAIARQAVPAVKAEQVRSTASQEKPQQQQQQDPEQKPHFNSFSARLAYQVFKWRQG